MVFWKKQSKKEDATEIITAKFTDCSEIFSPPVVFKITFLLYKLNPALSSKMESNVFN